MMRQPQIIRVQKREEFAAPALRAVAAPAFA
jgi:hypothetical protein